MIGTCYKSLLNRDSEATMRSAKGFSLIELLIVVAIILIIAAIGVPGFLRSRMAANEASAASSVRSVNTAMITYNSAYPTVGFAATLASLGPGGITAVCPVPPTSSTACLIDGQLASGTRSGYSFTLTNVTGTPYSTYNVMAAPTTWN